LKVRALLIVVVLCFAGAVVTHRSDSPSLGSSFSAGIDWSTPTNPSDLKPRYHRGVIPDSQRDAVAHVDNMLKALDNPAAHGTVIVPDQGLRLQRPTIVARFSSDPTKPGDYAEAASLDGKFIQTCQLLSGGAVGLLSADELTYLVVYMPPPGVHLAPGDCKGHEVFFVEKQASE